MANVQKENGYTPIANELLEQLCKVNINGTQFRIIMVIWRMTYGFSRKSHEVSVGFMAKSMNADVRTLKRELNKLIEMNIVTVVKEASFDRSRVVEFNKNYDTWALNNHLVVNLSPADEIITSPGGEDSKYLVANLPPKKEIERKNLNQDRMDFQIIIDLYNSICLSYPKVTKLSEARKKTIKARLNTYTMDDLKKLFTIAEESDFLKGKNDRNWSCTFDWLLKDSNMAKVLDGNYSKREGKENEQYKNNGYGHVLTVSEMFGRGTN